MDNKNKKKSTSTSIISLILIILSVFLIFYIGNRGTNGKQVDVGAAYNMAENQEISDIYFYGGVAKLRKSDSKISDKQWPKNADYYFEYTTTIEMQQFYELSKNIDCAKGLREFDATVSAEQQAAITLKYRDYNRIIVTSAPVKASLLSTLLPYMSVIVVLVIGILMFKMLSGKGQGAGGFAKSKAKLNERTNIRFSDIAGAEEEKEETQEIVEFLKNPAKFKALGARIPKGVLLVGPPGTGKTLLAKAVAGESNVPFFSISGSDFVELYVGVGAGRVRDLFETAKRSAPCIIFIDEIDAVGRQRGAGLGGGNDEREQTLNQLLVEMDGFESNEGIIVLAATNRADVLDPALLRPGRFDRQIYVNVPDVKGREGIMKIHAKNKPIDESVNFTEIARLTSGFTGADIENFLNEAAILAARDNRLTITMEDITEGINKVLVGPQKKSRLITPEDKKLTAYHESGHAILAKILNYGDAVHEVSIIPRGMAGGFTSTRPENDNDHLFYKKLCDKISMTMGGRIAEEIVFGDITAGASSDISHATDIARRMVTEWGMSKRLGFINYGKSNEVFIGRDYQTQVNYSEETASIIDEEIKAIMDSCYEKGKKILTENRNILDNMAKLLIEKETIYSEEVDAIIKGANYEDVAKALDEKAAEAKKRNEERKKKAEVENFKKMQELKIKAAEALTNAGVITKQDFEMIKKEAMSQSSPDEKSEEAKSEAEKRTEIEAKKELDNEASETTEEKTEVETPVVEVVEEKVETKPEEKPVKRTTRSTKTGTKTSATKKSTTAKKTSKTKKSETKSDDKE